VHTLWTFHRRLVVVTVIVVVLLLAAVVVLTGSRHGAPPATSDRPGERVPVTAPTIGRNGKAPGNPFRGHLARTSLVEPPQTAVQKQVDTELAQAETPAAIATAEKTSVPAPAVSAAYPAIKSVDRNDPTAYAIAFVTELLDTNYASDTRAGLLAWAEHEEAPNTLPGVPASVGSKALVLSLADPGLPGGTPSPVPSAIGWESDVPGDTVQSVSNVQAEVDPDWTQIVSEGWQPRDPLMTMETVTGTMTIAVNGDAAPPESFSLTLTLGSAAHAPGGYGAVAAGDWTLS
jgi:hypothetical protein